MPDTRASRKRQIQITPKPFTGPIRGAGAPRSARAIPNLTVAGSFHRALARAPARNRGKMIRRRRPAIRFRLNRGSQAAARSHLVLPRPVDASDPQAEIIFVGFCLGSVSAGGEARLLACVRTRWAPIPDSIIGRDRPWQIRRLRFRFDARERAAGLKPLAAVPTPTIAGSIGTRRKHLIKTISCSEISITDKCYLCNTLWKRGGAGSLEAVPLLRVQKSSVIVITRRRGASRGRPVRWFA